MGVESFRIPYLLAAQTALDVHCVSYLGQMERFREASQNRSDHTQTPYSSHVSCLVIS